MATKAQNFSSAVRQRSARPSTAKTPRTRSTEPSGSRNQSKHAGRKAVYALEDTTRSARPSRKSTRGASKAHIKHDSAMHAKVVLKAASPKRRATMRKNSAGA